MDKNRVVYSTKEIGDFTCPFFGISIKGLGEHNCATQSSVLGKNRAYCCISKCPSKWRRCPICLEQGVNNSCSVELKTGYCKFHKKHGPEAKNDGNSDRRAINGRGRVASQKELKEADNYIARYEKSKISDSAMSSKKEERGEKEKNNQKGGDIKKTFKELSHFDRIQVVRDAVSSNQGGNAAAAEELGISLALVGFYMQADNLDEKVKKMLKKDAPNPLGFAIAVKLSVLPAVIQIETATQIIENDFYYKNIFRALSSRFVKLKDFDLTNLLKASVELKVVSGLNNWKERLNNAIIESQYEDESYNEMKRYDVDYEKALKDIESLNAFLVPFEKQMTLKEFYDKLLGLIYNLDFHINLLSGNDDSVEMNVKAVTTFLNSVEELLTLFEIEYGSEKKFPLKFFLSQIKTLAAFSRYNVKEKPGYGVQVTALNEIRGLKFDYIFIAGLTDGDFPTRFSPEIFFSGSFAKEEIRHQTEERYHFYQALCSWEKGLYLTHPVTDDKKELVESNFLIEFKTIDFDKYIYILNLLEKIFQRKRSEEHTSELQSH